MPLWWLHLSWSGQLFDSGLCIGVYPICTVLNVCTLWRCRHRSFPIFWDLPFVSWMNHQNVASRMPPSVTGLKVFGCFVHSEADTRVLSCVTSSFHFAILLESSRIIKLVKQKRWLVIWYWSLDMCPKQCMAVMSRLVVTFGRAGNCGGPFRV